MRSLIVAIVLVLGCASTSHARIPVARVGFRYAREYVRFQLSGHHAPRLHKARSHRTFGGRLGGGVWRPFKIARFAPQ